MGSKYQLSKLSARFIRESHQPLLAVSDSADERDDSFMDELE